MSVIPHNSHRVQMTHTCTLRTATIDSTCAACMQQQDQLNKSNKLVPFSDRIVSPNKHSSHRHTRTISNTSRYMRITHGHRNELFDDTTNDNIVVPHSSIKTKSPAIPGFTHILSPHKHLQTIKQSTANNNNNNTTINIITASDHNIKLKPVINYNTTMQAAADGNVPDSCFRVTHQSLPKLVLPKPPLKLQSPNKSISITLHCVNTTEQRRLSNGGLGQLNSVDTISNSTRSASDRSSIEQLYHNNTPTIQSTQPTTHNTIQPSSLLSAPLIQRIVSLPVPAQSHQSTRPIRHSQIKPINTTSNTQQTKHCKRQSADDSVVQTRLHTPPHFSAQFHTSSIRSSSQHNKLLALNIDSVRHSSSSRPATPILHSNPFLQYNMTQVHDLSVHTLNVIFTCYADRNDVILHNSSQLRQLAIDLNQYIIELYKKSILRIKPNIRPDALNKIVQSELPYILYGYNKKQPDQHINTMIKNIILKLNRSKQKCISRVEFTTLFSAFAQQYINIDKQSSSSICCIQ